MAFTVSLVIIFVCNYLAIAVFFRRNRAKFANMATDLKSDVALSKIRKKQSKDDVKKDGEV